MAEKIVLPDYTNCLVNLMASIRRHFLLPYKYSTLKKVDCLLDKNQYRTVVVLLLDGMGSKIIDKHLPKTAFLQKNKLMDFLSVFPCTTVAATTSVQTTKSPIENGWLGWHQYFHQLDKDVIMFLSAGYYDGEAIQPHVANTIVPYTSFEETLNKAGYVTKEINPSWSATNPCNSFDEFIDKIVSFSNSGDKKQYMYAYWDEPDHSMHDLGTTDVKITEFLQMANDKISELAHKLPSDAVVFVIADHGHHDVSEINLYDYPDILELLERLPSIEPRNTTFYVKKNKLKKFDKLFNKYFGNDFKLFTKQEVLDKQLFGLYEHHPLSEHFIGDFQACAIGDYMFGYSTSKSDESNMKSTHAGILEDEMTIPLIKVIREE